MPSTLVRHCSWCAPLIHITIDKHALCPMCGGVMIDGPGPNTGTYTLMTTDEILESYSRMARDNRASRAQ